MTLIATKETADTATGRPRPDDAERLAAGLNGRRRNMVTSGHATELRTLLAPDERWMVAAYGE